MLCRRREENHGSSGRLPASITGAALRPSGASRRNRLISLITALHIHIGGGSRFFHRSYPPEGHAALSRRGVPPPLRKTVTKYRHVRSARGLQQSQPARASKPHSDMFPRLHTASETACTNHPVPFHRILDQQGQGVFGAIFLKVVRFSLRGNACGRTIT